jgi:HEAT repeat protein
MERRLAGRGIMDLDMLYLTPVQPTFLEVIETSSGLLELFPAVWSAAEGLTSPDVHVRSASLSRLLELGAPRISPLISYLLATCILEPDLPLRCRIVRALGELLIADEAGRQAPDAVRRHMIIYLAQMRTRSIFSLLQAINAEPNLEAHVTRLLNNCPHAGTHLSEIFSDREVPLAVRQQAVHLVGQAGFLDAVPSLERLASRLEARRNGQQSMPFAPPPTTQDESKLLQEINQTLWMLRQA